MTAIADSSPLIFLGKLRRLGLIHRVLRADIIVPSVVRDEVLNPPLDPWESRELELFLGGVRIETVARPRRFALGMSHADNAVLTLALRMKADLLLADERIIRRIAGVEGIRPVGTLGLLLQALRKGLLRGTEVRRLVDELIGAHGFRIGVELYAVTIDEIDRSA